MDERSHGQLLSVTEMLYCIFLPGDSKASGFLRVCFSGLDMKKARETIPVSLK